MKRPVRLRRHSGGGGVLRRLRRRRAVSFRHWARRLAGRLAGALVLAAFLPAYSAIVGAQGSTIGVCMRTSPETAAFRTGGDLAPDGPPRGGAFTPPNSFVRAAVQCAESFAAANLVPIGMNIWGGLAIIITIWTGIQMMFGGGFGIGEILSLILLLGFPFAVLTFYNTAVGTPWGNMTFSYMVSGMGQVVGAQLVAGAFVAFQRVVYDAVEGIWSSETLKAAATATEDQSGDASESPGLVGTLWGYATTGADALYNALFGRILRLIDQIARTVILIGLAFLFVLLLVVPALVAYCSYLWGYFSLLVAIILGPLLIPWVLIPQLQFLAWGWFRTLLGAGVHMMVAGACFAVVAQILTIPIIRFQTLVELANAQPVVGALVSSPGAAWGAGVAAIVESLPLILVAYLGAFKIGEITGMIMNGGSMPASGIGDRMRSMGSMRSMGRSAGSLVRGGAAAMGGRGAALAAAGVATGGAAAAAMAAGSVLSQTTRSNRQ